MLAGQSNVKPLAPKLYGLAIGDIGRIHNASNMKADAANVREMLDPCNFNKVETTAGCSNKCLCSRCRRKAPAIEDRIPTFTRPMILRAAARAFLAEFSSRETNSRAVSRNLRPALVSRTPAFFL